MEPFEIKPAVTYASRRWKGERKVTSVKRHRGQDAVVHFVNLHTTLAGTAPLLQFATSAEKIIKEEMR